MKKKKEKKLDEMAREYGVCVCAVNVCLGVNVCE